METNCSEMDKNQVFGTHASTVLVPSYFPSSNHFSASEKIFEVQRHCNALLPRDTNEKVSFRVPVLCCHSKRPHGSVESLYLLREFSLNKYTCVCRNVITNEANGASDNSSICRKVDSEASIAPTTLIGLYLGNLVNNHV